MNIFWIDSLERMQPLTRYILIPFAIFCQFLLVIGFVVRLSVRDFLHTSAPVYYATPPAILGGLACVASLYWFFKSYRKFSAAILLAALAMFGWHYQVNWYTAPPKVVEESQNNTDKPLRLVFWNVARGVFGLDGAIDDLKSYKPDLVGIVEAEGDDLVAEETWAERMADYRQGSFIAQTLFLSKKFLFTEQNARIEEHSMYKHVVVDTNGRTLHLFLVDLSSDIFLDRGPVLERLMVDVDKVQAEPVIIMGDFNTPGDSVFFSILRKSFVNAFEAAGNGYASTWPLPFPVLQIDHVWTNDKIEIVRCSHGWSSHSDHRPVLVDFRLKDDTTSTLKP